MSVCQTLCRLRRDGAGGAAVLSVLLAALLSPSLVRVAAADPAPLPPASIETTLPAAPTPAPIQVGGTVPRFIRVSGFGVVRARPGEAHVVFLVSSSDPYPVKALDDNTKKVNKVIAELINRGVQQANILSSESSLSPAAHTAATAASPDTGTPVDIDGVSGDAPAAPGASYTANARVEVVTYDITHATQIVQIGMYGGATSVLGMRFAPSNMAELKAQALILAMKDAANKSKILAAGVNARILYAISVTEQPAVAPEAPGMGVAPPAQVAVPVNIEITYAID
ncbi:MAG: SIMPL domain-containing protein [Chloroflexi bacterium]|nr:SIMPL domain-containing protein [Chloroflexota bacterium]